MLKELYTAALGMLPQQTRLEMTANNLANANTVGFKRSGIFEQSLIEARENLLNVRGDAETEDLPISQYVDFRPGALKKLETRSTSRSMVPIPSLSSSLKTAASI